MGMPYQLLNPETLQRTWRGDSDAQSRCSNHQYSFSRQALPYFEEHSKVGVSLWSIVFWNTDRAMSDWSRTQGGRNTAGQHTSSGTRTIFNLVSVGLTLGSHFWWIDEYTGGDERISLIGNLPKMVILINSMYWSSVSIQYVETVVKSKQFTVGGL